MAGPQSTNFFTDNEDLQWHLEHSVDWPALVRLVERDFRLADGPATVEEAVELYRTILEEAGRFVAREVAPYAAELDEHGPRLEGGEVIYPERHRRIFDGLREMGVLGMVVPRELGGMNVPLVLEFVFSELLARADVGLMTHAGFFGNTALALLTYAADEGKVEVQDGRVVKTRFAEQIRELAEGRAWGCMVMTEPGAGSDVAALRTRARLDAGGVWRLSGEKIFITSGDGQHQIVLARTEGEESGLEGLSLFWVPRVIERGGERITNVAITKLEHKLGHTSSATVSLLYEDSEAELIGERGQGFRLMLRMMNAARIAVGFEAIGLCEAALRMARAYASQRRAMGKLLREHELIADMLEEMDTDLRGLRALAFEALEHAELQHRLELGLRFEPPADAERRTALEQRVRRHRARARDLTPLLKYLGAEKAVEMARRNMQIHGGMGYMRETGADKLLRDALVVPVYEGTSQIQALMALKDRLGAAIKQPVRFMRESMEARLRARTARGLEQELAQAETFAYRAMEHILWRVLGSKLKSEWRSRLSRGPLLERLDYLRQGLLRSWDPRHDFSFGLLHAERLCRMLADVEIARLLVRDGRRHPERLVYAERYVHRMMPRLQALAAEITGGGITPQQVLVAAAGDGAGSAQEPAAAGSGA
ncbi:MAG: hypothetical protein KatS3mg102_2356 [Planctomycetota bacterium]|nr:MAG: hypothetical protein KatS3mg102_2356 [Planctomycetota bacterium]